MVQYKDRGNTIFLFSMLDDALEISFLLLLATLISSGVYGYEILFDGMTPLLDAIFFTKAVSALIILITPSCFALQS